MGLRNSKPHSRRGFVAGNGTKLIESVDSKMSKMQMSKYTFRGLVQTAKAKTGFLRTTALKL